MTRIVSVDQGPSITDSGTLARVVQLEDGSGQVQSYNPKTGWTDGGPDLLAMSTSEHATVDILQARGLTPEQIEEVLFDPEK